jgi:hypothetical protein
LHARKTSASEPLVLFAEFLATAGAFDRWVAACPLEYRSGNAADKRGVAGTLMLGLLARHRRYAPTSAPRGDAVAAQALRMRRVVSEEALRRAQRRIDEVASTAWIRPALMHGDSGCGNVGILLVPGTVLSAAAVPAAQRAQRLATVGVRGAGHRVSYPLQAARSVQQRRQDQIPPIRK